MFDFSHDHHAAQSASAPDAPASPAAHLLDELQRHGWRSFGEDPDPRPLPCPDDAEGAIDAVITTLAGLFADTRLEDDTESLLWAVVNLFHRQAERLARLLDDNEAAQRRSQAEQDGSEVRSVDLERLTAQGLTLIEKRNAFEFLRDAAAERFAVETGSAWRPRSGSKVNHRALTSAVIDSRDFVNAKRRTEHAVLVPEGQRIAFAGGAECNDHQRIWEALDKARTRHPDMILLHGGAPRGAERIAACWADNRKVAQVVFKPDWARHRNAAPFKRNDQLLDALPIGVIVFPGSGIVGNLADKARKLGIPVWRCGAPG